MRTHHFPIRPLTLLLIVSLAGVALLPAQRETIEINLTSAEAVIDHSGAPLTNYGVGVLNDDLQWEIDALSQPLHDGSYRHVDFDRLYFDEQRFYRVFGPIDPNIADWMRNYALPDLADFEEVSPRLSFFWTPFPSADPGQVSYTCEVFPMIENELTGELGRVARPLVAREGVTGPAPSFHLQESDAALNPGGLYAVRVTASADEGVYRGRPVPFRAAPAPVLYGMASPPPLLPGFKSGNGKATDWAEVAELIGKIREGKEAAMQGLRDNPLVQEVELIEQLKNILSTPESIREAALQLLRGELEEALSDPNTAVKVMCYLESLIKYVATHSDTIKRKPALKRRLIEFARQLKEKKELLEAAIEKGEEIQETLDGIIEDLRNTLTALTDPDELDPVELLLSEIEDRLIEKIQEMLVKLVGAKAAGALVSIFTDLVNFADFLGGISDLESLCREYNRILIEAVNCSEHDWAVNNEFWHILSNCDLMNCTLVIRAELYCFKHKEGSTDPNEGEWVTSPVMDGDKPYEAKVAVREVARKLDDGDPATEDDGMRIDYTHPLNLQNQRCPEGQGPCLVLVYVRYDCPDENDPGTTVRGQDIGPLFGGYLKCR